jgi:carbon monoxide dehydrogenase subunit G
MKVEGNYTFEAPREMVYQLLQDPEVLAKTIPGCEQLNRVAEHEYETALAVTVGPIKGQFKAKIVLSDFNPPEGYKMEINATGPAGFVNGTGVVHLEELEALTLMSYQGDAQFGGRIVSVGQRLLDTTAKSLTRQSLESMNQHIQAKVSLNQTGKGDDQAVELKSPTQAEFATGVAKGVLDDLLPPERRPLLIGAGLALAVLTFLLLRPRRKPTNKEATAHE